MSESESAGGDALCRACGKPEREHPWVMNAADIDTPADCSWVIEVMEIEANVVLPILGLVGMGRGDVPSDRLRAMSISMWELYSGAGYFRR